MKTIIKPGKRIAVATCPMCECEFRYEEEDVYHNYTREPAIDITSISTNVKQCVDCPNCGYAIIIGPKTKLFAMAGEPIKC